jgi:hypothetical protein
VITAHLRLQRKIVDCGKVPIHWLEINPSSWEIPSNLESYQGGHKSHWLGINPSTWGILSNHESYHGRALHQYRGWEGVSQASKHDGGMLFNQPARLSMASAIQDGRWQYKMFPIVMIPC